jgi:tRNA threonylcarbamoyladenosine biosynthesis protein TsaB
MLLAVDTSTQQIGLALYDGNSVIAEETWQSGNHHTVELSPAISRLFAKCSITAKDLTCLGVALGPGSFTGLRIGLSVVKGIALYSHIPVLGIPTLDILAGAQPLQEIPLLALLRAGRGRLAARWYEADFRVRKWKPVGDYQITWAEDLPQVIESPTLVFGEFTGAERQVLEKRKMNIFLGTPAQCLRRPSYLAELAWEKFERRQFDDVNTLTPTYLHTVERKPA